MRIIKVIAFQFFILFLVSISSFAQKSFEGEVDLKYTGERGDNTIKYFTKDGMVRLEMGENAKADSKAPKMGTIIVKDKNLFMLMPEKKMYIEKPLDLNAQVKKLEKRNDIGKNLKKTGKEEDILGYKAEQWTITDNKGEVEVWSTNELGNFTQLQALSGMNRQNMPEWLQELMSSGFFPLLVVQHGKDGKELNRLEATNIDKKSLDNTIFEVPADYQKIDMQKGNMRDNSSKTGK